MSQATMAERCPSFRQMNLKGARHGLYKDMQMAATSWFLWIWALVSLGVPNVEPICSALMPAATPNLGCSCHLFLQNIRVNACQGTPLFWLFSDSGLMLSQIRSPREVDKRHVWTVQTLAAWPGSSFPPNLVFACIYSFTGQKIHIKFKIKA